MAWFLVPFVAIALLVVPYFAADSRDGADWKPAALRAPARGTRRTLPFPSRQELWLSARQRQEF